MFRRLFPAASHAVVPVHDMNELYVASTMHNHNSDTVFYMNHIDGPYVCTLSLPPPPLTRVSLTQLLARVSPPQLLTSNPL
jgi:hypothetical protein